MDRFRPDLKIIRQVQRGEVSFIVKDPVALKYYRFGTLEVSLFKCLDGTRDHAQVAQSLSAETGLSLNGPMVASFVEELKKKDLIERSGAEKSLVLLERLRKERKLKAEEGADGRDTLYMRFPFYDPDNLYNKIIKRISFLWSRKFFVVYLILFSLAATIIVSNWGTVSAGLGNLYSFQDKGFRDIVMFIGVLFTIIVLHENGHGLTCKRYGGEVHEIGFMLIYFMPAFYANVTDTWTFESKAAKLWVTFAGAFVELVICSIATFVWYLSTPGYFTHDLAFTFMITAGLSSILINMNPLIRLDGYFALVDYLEIPKLGDDSTKYLGLLVRKYIFRVPVEIPGYDGRLKLILFTYGVLSFLYRILILTLTLLFFNRQLGRLFPEMAIFIFPLLAYRLLRKKLRAMWNSLHHLYLDKKELLMKPRWLVTSMVAIAVALGLFLFLPLSYSYHATFVMEAAEQVPVRAQTEGFIGSVLAREGDFVRRGALLAVMRDIDLEQKRDSLRSQISLLDRNMLVQRAQGDTAQAIQGEQQRAQLSQALAETESQLSSLNLTAPADGIITTPRVEDKAGTMLPKGAELCQIAKSGALRARVVVDDWDLKDVQVGSPAVLRLNAVATSDLKGRVISLAPASQLQQRLSPIAAREAQNEDENRALKLGSFDGFGPGASGSPAKGKKSAREQAESAADEATSPFEAPLVRFDALIGLDDDTEGLKPGMSGDAKIYGLRRPLAVTVWQGLRDWFRSKVWW
jgi:putative peptide zinc metalloprotease protein